MIGAVIQSRSGTLLGRVVATDDVWWRVEWDDGTATWSDSRVILRDGMILLEATA